MVAPLLPEETSHSQTWATDEVESLESTVKSFYT